MIFFNTMVHMWWSLTDVSDGGGIVERGRGGTK
jgi:hypothetical protein